MAFGGVCSLRLFLGVYLDYVRAYLEDDSVRGGVRGSAGGGNVRWDWCELRLGLSRWFVNSGCRSCLIVLRGLAWYLLSFRRCLLS